jgi:S1-C subfamily serine protease
MQPQRRRPEPPDPALLLGDEDGQGGGDGGGGGMPGGQGGTGDHDERLAAVSRDDAYWEERARTARTPWKVPLGAALLVLLLPHTGGLLSPAPAVAARTGEVGVVLEDTTGHQVEVTAVLPGEPAASSGMRAGDIVATVDGVRPADAAQAVARIRGSAPGRRMTLELLRADVPLRVTLTVAEPELAHPEGSLGAGLRNAESGGAQVTTVRTGSPAAAIHLAPGDRVLAVDGSPTRSAAGFVALVHAHRAGDRVTLTVLRAGARYEVTATLARL